MAVASAFAQTPPTNALPFVVACVGDSVTYGHGASKHASTTYPAQLQEKLGAGWKVLNFGRNASTALDDGKEWNGPGCKGYRSAPEFQKALECGPDVVLFMLGSNDSKPVNWDGKADDVKRDYAKLVDDFLALDPPPVVVIGVSPFVKKDAFTIRGKVVGDELAPWQRSFAAKRGLPCVDIHEATKAAAETCFIDDGVHPNDAGYGIIAEAFAAKLREIGPKLPAPRASRRQAPRLSFGADGTFSFLHITDVQEQGKLHPRSAAVLRAAIAATKPQLAILTGDNVNGGGNLRDSFEKSMGALVDIFVETKTPFCVTFGNHDSERKGDGFLTRQQQYDWFKERGGPLFVDHDVPELTGVGSGAIELVRDKGGRPSVRLFVMDSGSYAQGGGYDGCHSDQIAWYEYVAADGLPHLWFQHIIVPDANDNGLFRAAAQGEGGIEMPVRGEKVRAVLADGVKGAFKEVTCPPKWSAYRDARHTHDGRTLYDAWRANGHMVGAYFGHDHKNTFDGTDDNGIRIGMTKALTLCSYNDNNPGLRLFVVHPDGSFETQIGSEKQPFPVPGDGSAYRPAKGL